MDEEVKINSSKDLGSLKPESDHEILILLYESQKVILKRQEDFNEWRRECEQTFREWGSRIGKLEGAVYGMIGALALALMAWAVEQILSHMGG